MEITAACWQRSCVISLIKGFGRYSRLCVGGLGGGSKWLLNAEYRGVSVGGVGRAIIDNVALRRQEECPRGFLFVIAVFQG